MTLHNIMSNTDTKENTQPAVSIKVYGFGVEEAESTLGKLVSEGALPKEVADEVIKMVEQNKPAEEEQTEDKPVAKPEETGAEFIGPEDIVLAVTDTLGDMVSEGYMGLKLAEKFAVALRDKIASIGESGEEGTPEKECAEDVECVVRSCDELIDRISGAVGSLVTSGDISEKQAQLVKENIAKALLADCEEESE